MINFESRIYLDSKVGEKQLLKTFKEILILKPQEIKVLIKINFFLSDTNRFKEVFKII